MKDEPVYWTMKNGQKINVMDMSVSHMQNTLKMLIRNNTVQVVKKDFTLNGDMANQFNDDDLDYGHPFHDAECRGDRWN